MSEPPPSRGAQPPSLEADALPILPRRIEGRWMLQVDANGTLRLSPSWGARWGDRLVGLALAAAVCGMVGWLTGWVVPALCGFLAVAAACFLLGTTDWRVGPNLLEASSRWFPGVPPTLRRFTDARLVLRASRTGSTRYWSLDVVSDSGTARIDGAHELGESTECVEEYPYRQMEALGAFLSRQTGWPLSR